MLLPRLRSLGRTGLHLLDGLLRGGAGAHGGCAIGGGPGAEIAASGRRSVPRSPCGATGVPPGLTTGSSAGALPPRARRVYVPFSRPARFAAAHLTVFPAGRAPPLACLALTLRITDIVAISLPVSHAPVPAGFVFRARAASE